MAKDDYAIVVGINTYPGLGAPGNPADLRGPENDALAVANWLMAEDGGDVPETQVELIRSSDFAGELGAAKGLPQQQKLRDAYDALGTAAKLKPRATRDDPMLGRRLYIYMSGHGFSPSRYRGALYVANATPDDGLHSYASGWLEWFQDNYFFKEYVLWLDCCMDREFGFDPESIKKKTARFGQIGGTFIGFAAPRQFKTVERPIPTLNGEIHGVFTTTLLDGLKGGAVDSEGFITGRSLGDYLINAMSTYLTPADLKDPIIAREPEIVKADKALVFATNRTKQSTAVSLNFPAAAVGNEAILWGGEPVEPKKFLAAAVVEKKLENGLYLVEVPAAGLRHGFEVTGTQSNVVNVTSPGATPVAASGPDDTFVLSVNPQQPTAEIFLIDQKLSKQAQSRRILTAGFPFGLYKVKVRVGNTVTETIILLDRELDFSTVQRAWDGLPTALSDPMADLSMQPAAVNSAAPLPGSGLTHETHRDALEAWKVPGARRRGFESTAVVPAAEIRLMARVWSGERATAQGGVHPWEGTEVLDASGQVVRTLKGLPPQGGDDPCVSIQVPVAPGTYFLRDHREGGRAIECALTVPPGWTLEVFLLALAPSTAQPPSDTAGSVHFNRITMLMRRVGDLTRDAEFEQTLEAARIALVSERRVLNRHLEEMLIRKFQNPIAGILGAHLLLQQEDRRPGGPSAKLELLDEVIGNLRAMLGNEHPDVEALSLRCPTPALRASKPFRSPPLFARSWDLIVQASRDTPSLLPTELWERVRAAVPVSGYFFWGCDEQSKAARTQQLKAWLATAAKQMSAADEEVVVGAADLAGASPAMMAAAAAPASPDHDTMVSEFAGQLHLPPSVVAALLRETPGAKK